MHTQNLYRDIQKRTGGEIYIGVVGPVRTGKSTFIKRFMDLLVLPYMTDDAERIPVDTRVKIVEYNEDFALVERL